MKYIETFRSLSAHFNSFLAVSLFQFTLVLAFMLACLTGHAQIAYISNNTDNTITVINVATNTVTDTITGCTTPNGISASPDGSALYVTNYSANTVSVINTTTNTITAIIPVGHSPYSACVSPDGKNVYVTNLSGKSVSVIKTATDSVTATITVGTNPHGLAVSPDGSMLYVANEYSNNISVISTAADTVVLTIPTRTHPFGVCMSHDGGRVYISNNGDNSVSVINTAADSVSATIAVGNYPEGICISPDGSKIYVANNHSNTVSVINTATGIVWDSIVVGVQPIGISVSPDGRKLYVANNRSNSVSVINAAVDTVTQTIPVGNYPIAFGNFISTYGYVPSCRSIFSIVTDTLQLQNYVITDHSYGIQPIQYNWSWGDSSPVDTILYPSHIYADSGRYNICLSITDSSGCQSTLCDSILAADTSVSVDVFNPVTTVNQVASLQTGLVTVYPNPFTSQTTIAFSEEQRGTILVITDIMGKEIRTLNFTGRQLTLDKGEMNSGIYFVQVTGEKKRWVGRIVIE